MNSRAIKHIKSGLISGTSAVMPYGIGKPQASPTNISGFISDIQFERLAHDIRMWREAIREMELSYNPMRVKAIRMYIDVVEDGFVKAVIQRWLELTMQRDYCIYQMKDGERVESKVLTQQLSEQAWFADYIQYTAEALLWGYSLIEMGDIVDDSFPFLTFTRRENIRPDGIDGRNPVLTNMVYAIDGVRIKDDKVIDAFNHWIPTKTNIGASRCGYGLLYNISLYAIHLRHILEWNMDFIEAYGMPIKKGKTNKTGKDRKLFEDFLRGGASNAWVLLDRATDDDIEYVMAKEAGTAWKTYDNLEDRLKGIILQILLGHTDAMATSPDKLGGNQKSNKDGDNLNLVQQAMNSKQVTIGNFVCRNINEIGAPRFRKIGKMVGSNFIRNLIPVGYSFGLKNDTEENEITRRINNQRLTISTYAKNLNDAGYNLDAEELGKELGMKVTEAPPETRIYQERTSKTTINREGGNENEQNAEV